MHALNPQTSQFVLLTIYILLLFSFKKQTQTLYRYKIFLSIGAIINNTKPDYQSMPEKIVKTIEKIINVEQQKKDVLSIIKKIID